MLTAEEIRALIVVRLDVAHRSCNSHHRGCVKQQVRALIAVLNDGASPTHSDSVCAMLDAAGIPYVDHDDGSFSYEDEWLAAHGFEVVKGETDWQDVLRHPKLNASW